MMRMRQVSEFEGLRGRRLVLTTDRTKAQRSAIGAPPHPSINMARLDWAALQSLRCSGNGCSSQVTTDNKKQSLSAIEHDLGYCTQA